MRGVIAAALLLTAAAAHACDRHVSTDDSGWHLTLETGLAGDIDPQRFHDGFNWSGDGGSVGMHRYQWTDRLFVPGPLADVALLLRHGPWSIGPRHISAVMDGFNGMGVTVFEVTRRWTLWSSQ